MRLAALSRSLSFNLAGKHLVHHRLRETFRIRKSRSRRKGRNEFLPKKGDAQDSRLKRERRFIHLGKREWKTSLRIIYLDVRNNVATTITILNLSFNNYWTESSDIVRKKILHSPLSTSLVSFLSLPLSLSNRSHCDPRWRSARRRARWSKSRLGDPDPRGCFRLSRIRLPRAGVEAGDQQDVTLARVHALLQDARLGLERFEERRISPVHTLLHVNCNREKYIKYH